MLALSTVPSVLLSPLAAAAPQQSSMDATLPSSASDTVTTTIHDGSQSQSMPLIDKQFCMATLKSLKKSRRAIAFLAPVDPVALNIPDYFDIVKHPMDLGTIETKLIHDQYSSLDAFKSDMELMFYNCHLYNHATDPVTQDAKKLEEIFHRALEKRDASKHNASSSSGDDKNMALAGLMPDDQFKRCESALKEMKKSKYQNLHWPFLNPVDAVAWGATDYYDIIKRPMDISTLEKNLFEYKYANEEEFEADVHVMFNNCYTYNPPGHPVCQLGKELELVFNAFWEKIHTKSVGGTAKGGLSWQTNCDNHSSTEAKNPGRSRSGTGIMKVKTCGITDGVGVDTAVDMSLPAKRGKRTHGSDNDEDTTSASSATPTILRLKIPSAASKEQNPTSQQTSNTNSPANANNNMRLAISKNPPSSSALPVQKLALASTLTTSRASNTHTNKRRAVSDAAATKPTPPALSLGLSATTARRPPPPPPPPITASASGSTAAAPASGSAAAIPASVLTPVAIANPVSRPIPSQQTQLTQPKLGMRSSPEIIRVETPKPEQNILTIDTLFDQIEREKDIAKRQKREQQEQRERYEHAQREKELRRRQEEETKRK
ncbi:Bromodomain-containing protein [Dichotomocladium elegans]|nr:Bromodomain-containing protein [Dichotomocladium elegans]